MNLRIIAAVKARVHFGEIMKRAFKKGEHFIVEKSGIPMVAILNANEYMRFFQEREEHFKILKSIQAKIPSFPPEQVQGDVQKAIEAIRKRHD